MQVNITDYGDKNGRKFIEYTVSGLLRRQIEYLNKDLAEETRADGELLILTMYFDEMLYPLRSDAAKLRMDDFIAREEIEMNVFLSGFLEDM